MACRYTIDGKTYDPIAFEAYLEKMPLADAAKYMPGVKSMPEMPFKTTWPDLALKRIIRYAAENSYDRISWDTGATNADRFDLSKQIDELHHWKEGDRIGLAAYEPGRNADIFENRSPFKPEELENIVGKDVAERILKGEGESPRDAGPDDVKVLRGDGLKIGGEGMTAFYDRQLPIIANKLGKKFGAKVEESALDANKNIASWERFSEWVGNHPEHQGMTRDRQYNIWTKGEESALVREFLAEKQGVPVHSLPITDAMRSSVMTEGQPLFSPRVSNRKRTPEQIAADKHVFGEDEKVPLGQRIAELKKDFVTKAIRELVDPYIGIKKSDPAGYMAATTADSNYGAVDMFDKWGTLKFKDHSYVMDKETGGLNGLRRRLGAEEQDWIKWVAAHRAEKLKAEDRENLYRDEDIAAHKTLNQGTLETPYEMRSGRKTTNREAAYLDALAEYEPMRKNLVDLAVEGGLLKSKEKINAEIAEVKADKKLTPEQKTERVQGLEAMQRAWEDPFYVPFYRQAEGENSRGFVGPGGFVGQTAGKKLKGGTEKLNRDLWENLYGNAAHMIDAAIRNRAANHIRETLIKQGSAEEVDAATYENKMSKADKANTIWTMVDGEKVYTHIEDPMMLKAVTALDYVQSQTPLMNYGRAAKKLLQVGVAASPKFQVRQLVQDTIQAMSVSPISNNVFRNVSDGFSQQNLGNALKNLGRAVFNQELKQGKISRDTADAIAAGATMRYASGADQSLRGDAFNLNSDSKVKGFFEYGRRFAQAYTESMGVGENVSRLALFKQLREQGEGADLAGHEARELANFHRIGASPIVRHAVELIPYLNPWLQGLYKVGTTAADANKNVALAVGGKVARQMTKKLATVIIAGAVLDMALDKMYADDEDFKAREEYDRNANYWFKAFGQEWRMPRPFEVGALSRLASLWMQSAYNSDMPAKRAWKNTLEIFANRMGFDITNVQLVAPLRDLAENETRTGRPIETTAMRRLRPEFRTGQDTSLVSQGISEVGNKAMRGVFGDNAKFFSPVQLDHLVQGYTAWLGTTALQIADTAIRPLTSEPGKSDKDSLSFWTGGFVSGDKSSERGSTFYTNMLYRQGEAIEEAFNSYRKLLKEGRGAEAKAYFEDNRENISKYPVFQKVKQVESQLNEQVRMIEKSPDLSGEQKRIQIMRLNAMKNRAAASVYETQP